MKKLIAVLAVATLMCLLCAQAFAASGDITVKDAKAYADAAMTTYLGTIPSGTAVVVRSYDTYADVYVNGKVCYISASALLNSEVSSDYIATLVKGTRVYQQASSSAKSVKLTKNGDVKLCAVKGDWALVQTTGSKGYFGYVKVDHLTGIRVK